MKTRAQLLEDKLRPIVRKLLKEGIDYNYYNKQIDKIRDDLDLLCREWTGEFTTGEDENQEFAGLDDTKQGRLLGKALDLLELVHFSSTSK